MVAVAAASLALALTILVLPPFASSAVAVALVAFSALPGILLARYLYGSAHGWGAVWLVGPMWGYALSCVVLLAFWVAGFRGLALLAVPLVTVLLIVPLGFWLRGALVAPRFGRGDVIALALLIVVLCALVARPFARVGAERPDGSRAYRAYFTADFVWRMAVVAELAKGDVPPKNPFYRGDALRYYWLAHVPAAAEYQLLKRHGRLESLLLANALAVDVLFVMFLYAFIRQWTASAAVAGWICAALFLASSFEGAEQLWRIYERDAPLAAIRTLNIEAVTRWFYGSLPVDGLQRVMWYQPQHAVAYAVGLSVVLIGVQAGPPIRPAVTVVAGVLLSAAVLFSSFTAMMTTVMAALVLGWRVMRERGWTPLVVSAIGGAIPMVLATASALRLKYVDDQSGNLVRIIVNPAAVYNAPVALFLSFGPFLVLAVLGAILAWRRRASGFWPIGVIIVVSFAFYFFVDVVDHQFVYVGWRAGHLLFIAFAALAGFLIVEARRDVRPLIRRGLPALALALFLVAVPTTVMDAYNTQDIDNFLEAAMGRWTLSMQPDELAAFRWIDQYTSPEAIVQVDPQARDPYTWCYIPAFAERRMAGGLPISMIPLSKYHLVTSRVLWAFEAKTAVGVYEHAAALRIDYLFIGMPERSAHPELESLLQSRPDLFRPVFRQGTVAIYYLERALR